MFVLIDVYSRSQVTYYGKFNQIIEITINNDRYDKIIYIF